MKRILIVDDDCEIRSLIKRYLEIDGYEVVSAKNGEDALGLLDRKIQLVILDVMMPGLDGFQVSEIIRREYNVPILFVSAKSTEQDKFIGFSVGGDDYLSKPFTFSDLSLKVKSLLRRYTQYDRAPHPIDATLEPLYFEHFTIDRERNVLLSEGSIVDITEREFRILVLLASNRGKIFSIKSLYESVWDDEYYHNSSNTVMVHIRNLRKKIEDNPNQPKVIVNVWGRGYKID